MHSITFLQDLAVVMIVAGAVTILFHRLNQPVVLGYIIAGLIIGPHTLPVPLIHDQETIGTLAELGVIFLMFSLGLEFNLRRLRQVGLPALVAAFLEITLMVFVGYELGLSFGWRSMDALFLGAILSISSTTIIVKALAELGKSKEQFSQIIFGILIVEDLLAIAMIALLSGIATTGTLQTGQLLMTIGRLVVFMAVVLVAGLLSVPRLLEFVGRLKSNETLLVAVLGLCFGACLLTVKLGFSVALGAFVIGAVMAEAREIGRIERLTEPIRDMFSALFFVAIGLLIKPAVILDQAGAIALITLAVIVGKVITCAFGTFVSGYDTRTSLKVGMGLAQIGEFSFIIASLGLTLGVTSSFLYPIAVAVSVITTFFTPYLIQSADRLVNWFGKIAPAFLIGYLELYTRWTSQVRLRSKGSLAARLIRKWVWQMTLNVILVIAAFLFAAFIVNRRPAWVPELPGGDTALKAGMWLAAVLVSLPFLIATFRKLQALGLLVSEISVSRAVAQEATATIRSLVAPMIPLAGLIGLGLLVLALSSAILPPPNVLLVMVAIAVLATILFWRGFIRIYSKAQYALHETFSHAPQHEEIAEPVLPALLKEAQMRTVTVPSESAAAGKLIHELQLRSKTGASIVAIERNSAIKINPGPDEDIQAGDKLLLLGSKQQLEAAIDFMLRAVT